MSKIKYSTITLILENRIRQGFYPVRLPNTMDLVTEFATSRKTITKALRPLVESGLIKSGAKRGMLINHTVQTERGIIAIISNFNPQNPQMDISKVLHKECRLIQQSGFEPLCVSMPFNSRFGNPERFLSFAANADGLLFTNSTLTLEIALYLEKLRKPFLSCNQMPVYRKLNYVETDNFACIRQIAEYLLARNYRKIAFFFPSELESYQRQTRKKWHQLAQELKLTDLPCNHFAIDSSQTMHDQIRDFLTQVRQGEKPDITLLWGGYLGEEISDYQLLTDFCQDGWKLMSSSLSFVSADFRTDNLYRLRVDVGKHTTAAINALLELLIAVPRQPIHRLIPAELTFMDELEPIFPENNVSKI